ncbi:MAG: phosphatase PAP2 family protein [Flavobacterium sp.]|nr:phosphatase PAP2 family protein [Flavobacterium sp.]
MLEKIVAIDTELFIYFNSFGSPTFDNLWLIITKQVYWSPFFIFLGYLIYKKQGLKSLGIVVVFIALLLLVCNESVEFCKETVKRLRPCNNPEITNIIRIVHHSKTFSFFSGHAANSLATMTFLFLILKKHYKYSFLIFLYPLIFAYSRIYLGVHYPTDILTGYVFGLSTGIIFYKGYRYFLTKVNLT